MFSNKKSQYHVVPVVSLKGVISPDGRGGLGGPQPLNIDNLSGALTKAFNVAGASAVVLDINSPGGSPTQSELIAQRIRELAEDRHIPVYAFAQDVAASGGYWLACAADEIYAARTSTIGSIGVVSGGFGFSDLADKLGIEDRTHTAGNAKRRLSPFKEMSEEDQNWMKERLEKMHELFKDWVKERRGSKLVVPEGVQKDSYLNSNIFTGDTWFGQEAVENGLIDGIGYMKPVLGAKLGDNVRLRYIHTKKPGLFSLMGAFASKDEQMSTGANAELVHAAADVMRREMVWAPHEYR